MKIIGLVENMAYMKCPCCNNPIYPFGLSKLDDVCETFELNPIASLPINPDLTKLVDDGKAEDIDVDAYSSLAKAVIDLE